MMEHAPFGTLLTALRQRPHAVARVFGGPDDPGISGSVYFYQTKQGVLVAAEVTGLPQSEQEGIDRIFAFHIHDGDRCSGTPADPFADTLGHFDPGGMPHPKHAGDLPALFGNGGYALQVVLTDRFSVQEILHKTVVIHSGPDDFTSQPAGNAGKKIACGQVEAFRGP